MIKKDFTWCAVEAIAEELLLNKRIGYQKAREIIKKARMKGKFR